MLLLYYFIIYGSPVDRSKYNDCNSTPFCKRNRFVSNQNWVALSDLSISNNNSFSIPILYEETQNKVLLNINFLLNSCVHIKITNFSVENGPKRYDCSTENSIVNQKLAKQHKLYTEERNSTHTILTANSIKIIIQWRPFIIFTYEGETLKLTFNNDNSMIFEEPEVDNYDDENDCQKTVAGTFQFFDRRVQFSGLPAHTLSLNLPDTTNREPIRFYNTDINRFEVDSGMSMYGSIPYIIGHSGNNSTSIFWCNPSETYADIYKDSENEKKVRFVSETNFIDFFVFVGNHSSVISEFSSLTGRSPMHQYFTFGYHQCRWTYYSSNEIRVVSANLDEKHIPHDVLWLDLDHTNDKMYFTFNNDYKDIKKLTKEVVDNQRRLVAQVDPHLKAINSYKVYKEASDRHFLITKDQQPFYGNCWPGRSVWVDFFNPNARQWWSKRFNFTFYEGSSPYLFVWNDMNEPAVFDVKDFTLPKNSLHFRGFQDRNIHNLYGHFMVISTYNGVIKRNEDENERAFVLTRSYFAGSQKYSLMWTGDNTASWEMLGNSLIMTLGLSVCSFPISGSDVGGFFDSPDEDLLSRWYQLGAFCYPFYRCHCHHLSAKREPDRLKGSYFDRTKKAIIERYTLLPLWYSLMRECHDSGRPIVRPIWFEFENEDLQNVEDQLLIGDSILIAPVVNEEQSKKKEREVTLPDSVRWFDFRSLQEIKSKSKKMTVKADLDVPAFIRGGRTFCMKETIRKSSEAMFNDPFTLIVCLDDTQKSHGKLYIDDGHTFNFTRGQFVYRLFEFKDGILMNSPDNGNANNLFYQEYSVVVKTIKIAGVSEVPHKIVNDKNGQNMKFKVKKGVIIIDDAELPVKEDWSLKFII